MAQLDVSCETQRERPLGRSAGADASQRGFQGRPFASRFTSHWVAALLLVAVTVALYGSSLGQPFTSDDYAYLHGCARLADTSLLSVFHPAVQGVVLPPFYRPTSVVFFLGLSRLFGAAPCAFHGCLLVLRIATLLLALLLFSRLLGHPGWGALAAVALAVSPYGIEPGVWAAAVPDSLMALFLMAALLCFDQLGRREAVTATQAQAQARMPGTAATWLVGVVVCGLLALVSKEPAVVLPFLLACLPARCGRLGKTAILALLAADALYVLLRLWMRAHVPTPAGWDYWYVLDGPRTVEWWRRLTLSMGLLVTGPTTTVTAIPAAMSGLTLLVTASILIARSRRGMARHGLALAALLVALPLAITGGVICTRYGYLSSAGVALILAALARLPRRGWARALTCALVGTLLLFQVSLTHFWIGEWGRAAHGSGQVAQFLASRPADEETVLLWIPAGLVNVYLGRSRCTSYALTDSIYPSWIKELSGRRERAVSLTLLNGWSRAVPETYRVAPDVVEIRGASQLPLPADPSVYTGSTEPQITTYAELLGQEPGLVRFRLKRAPHRAFFTLTDRGWEAL